MLYEVITDELSLDEWNRVLGVNLTGPMLCSRALAPALAETPGGGVIVNVASTRAFQSEPDTEAYSASKGGIAALTHALALSLGPAIRVNCIAPGWIDVTRLSPPGRRAPEALRPEDHAQHPAGRSPDGAWQAAHRRQVASTSGGAVRSGGAHVRVPVEPGPPERA